MQELRQGGNEGSRYVQLDPTDLRILAVLQREGRISKTALAEQVGISTSACLERMKRLEKDKIIARYFAYIDFRKLRSTTYFYTTIILRSHRQGDFGLFEKYVRNLKTIVECVALGGGIDYIIKFAFDNVDDYQAEIDMMLDANVGVDRYFTYIVTKTVVQNIQPSIT
jgi:Lrp/AsnC family transcriptional regulator of ectoine degradation